MTFDRMTSSLLGDQDIRLSTKPLVYWAAMIPVLYGPKTWVTFGRHLKILERYQKAVSLILPELVERKSESTLVHSHRDHPQQ